MPTWLYSMTGCKQSLAMATRLQLCPSLTQMTGLIGGSGKANQAVSHSQGASLGFPVTSSLFPPKKTKQTTNR